MSYATIDDLKLRLSERWEALYGSGSGEFLEAEAVSDLAAASAEIDGALGCRYAIPVTSDAVLPLLRVWCIGLAEELAWSRSGRGSLPENLKDRVARIRLQLERIADGSMQLAAAAENSDRGGAFLVDSAESVFSRKKLRGFGGA